MAAASNRAALQLSAAQPTNADDWIGINQILPELVALTGQEPPTTVRSLKDRAASGRLPEIETRAGKWGCPRGRLSAIGTRIGMAVPTAAVVQPKSRARRQTDQVAA